MDGIDYLYQFLMNVQKSNCLVSLTWQPSSGKRWEEYDSFDSPGHLRDFQGYQSWYPVLSVWDVC